MESSKGFFVIAHLAVKETLLSTEHSIPDAQYMMYLPAGMPSKLPSSVGKSTIHLTGPGKRAAEKLRVSCGPLTDRQDGSLRKGHQVGFFCQEKQRNEEVNFFSKVKVWTGDKIG